MLSLGFGCQGAINFYQNISWIRPAGFRSDRPDGARLSGKTHTGRRTGDVKRMGIRVGMVIAEDVKTVLSKQRPADRQR